MKNYVLIGAGFLTLVVICVAVIHFEAERTRTVMKETATNALKDGLAGTLGSGPNAKQVGDAVDKVQSILNDTAGEAAKETPGLVKPAAEAAHEVLQELRGTMSPREADAEKTPPRSAPSGTAKRMPVVTSILDEIEATMEQIIDERSRERTEGRESSDKVSKDRSSRGSGDDDRARIDPRVIIDPRDPVGSVLDLTRRATKSGDDYGQSLMKLTPTEETAWGKKLHAEVVVESKVVHDSAVNKRIARLVEPILARRERPEINYTFTVLQTDRDDLNAFSLPGGYVYVHSALIDFVQNDQELQFVLAHEIAHVDLEHCNRKLTYAARASDLTAPAIGGFVGVLHNIMSRPYAKSEEFDADAYALRAVVAAGQTRAQALSFPKRLGEYMKRKDVSHTRSPRETSVFSDVFARAEDHFSTHPPMDERIARLEAVEVDDGYGAAKGR